MLENSSENQQSAETWIGLFFIAKLADIQLQSWREMEKTCPNATI